MAFKDVLDYPVFKTIKADDAESFDKKVTEMLQDGWEIDNSFHHLLPDGKEMFVAFMYKDIADIVEDIEIEGPVYDDMDEDDLEDYENELDDDEDDEDLI